VLASGLGCEGAPDRLDFADSGLMVTKSPVLHAVGRFSGKLIQPKMDFNKFVSKGRLRLPAVFDQLHFLPLEPSLADSLKNIFSNHVTLVTWNPE